MKITLRLILSLVLVTAAAAFGFSLWQARQEEKRLTVELERRADVIADSLREAIRPALAADRLDVVQRIADRFSNRERLLGIAVHDAAGTLLFVSEPLKGKFEASKDAVVRVSEGGQPAGEFIDLNGGRAHAYSVTVGDQTPAPVLTLLHATRYIHDRVRLIWINAFLRFSIQALLISLTTLLIFYLNVMDPIRKTTAWIKSVRLGEESRSLGAPPETLLGPLAKEVTRMADSLRMARLAAEEEARLRRISESVWTPERLKEFVKTTLSGRNLFVVSHREPYIHMKNGNKIEVIVPASGLVTAIEPVLKACGGTWIAQGSGTADKETADANDRLRVPPNDPQYTLRRVWLSREEQEGYYYGFANEGLWPLCHIAHTRPTFRGKDWLAYKEVNEKFAEVVISEIEGSPEPCVLIQDYHFALLPRLIKEARPDARVTIFWHIPWPNPESFGICPWQKELLQGMLGADIIGFHTQFHCNNFMQTVDRAFESRIDYEHFTVTREGHLTAVKPFPISVAFSGNEPPAGVAPDRNALLKPYGLSAEYLGVGVDRLDYTKGIVERFRAVEHFLEENPSYQGRFTFVELGAPSRTLIPKYQEFMSEIEHEAERINQRLEKKNWKPILLLKKHHAHEEIIPFYRAANVCLVTSLHDGMNLVAKEYVMARDDDAGVLVLSQFTGAARELRDALIVNPYDVGQTSEAIRQALEMTQDEQTERMRRMRLVLKDRNIYRWAADLVGELAQVR